MEAFQAGCPEVPSLDTVPGPLAMALAAARIRPMAAQAREMSFAGSELITGELIYVIVRREDWSPE